MSAIQAAFQTWENDAGSYVDFTYGGPTPLRRRNDGVNVVDFIDLSPQTAYAVTEIWQSGGIISECDMIFNERYTFSTNLAPNTYDVQNLATHEAGHFLALENLYGAADSEQTMWWDVAFQETKKRTLEWGDRAGVRYIYPNRYQVGGGSLGYETRGQM
jgi:hypothetical protein